VSYLSKNLTKNLNPLPDYNTVKPHLPSYSIPKSQRFVDESTMEIPGPNSYFKGSYPNHFDDSKPKTMHDA
jgi:hypothetical protein